MTHMHGIILKDREQVISVYEMIVLKYIWNGDVGYE